MSLAVLKPGMLSTLQDRGRNGFQHLGVPVSGAMDSFSHRVANILVDNKGDEATLEITLRGPRLRFERDELIALCGADLSPTIDGIIAPEGKAIRVRAGAVLDFGDSVAGCRAYLAIHGGFEVPLVMGSRSTYDTARIGGLDARLATPRRDTPRPRVPAGSVAIAGEQTGVYPLDTPGGWQIIGRTPLQLFKPDALPPSLLSAGDTVRFVPISPQEFKARSEAAA